MSPLSLNPQTFQEGGSLLDDVDVKVTAAKFVKFDYNGAVNPPVPALGITMQDADGKDHDQYFSCGDAKYFSPSTDDKTPAEEGDFLIPIGDKTSLNNNTQAAKFFESLVNAGFPAAKLESGNISVLVGIEFHLRREAVKRTGLVRTGKNAGREQTVITVAKIHKLPWEASAPKANGNAAVKTAAPAAASGIVISGGGFEQVAAETITNLLMEHGTIPKSKLATLVFNQLKGQPGQKESGKLALNDAFLKSIEGAKLEAGVLSLA